MQPRDLHKLDSHRKAHQDGGTDEVGALLQHDHVRNEDGLQNALSAGSLEDAITYLAQNQTVQRISNHAYEQDLPIRFIVLGINM